MLLFLLGRTSLWRRPALLRLWLILLRLLLRSRPLLRLRRRA
jgi:hypothetical protein